MTAAASLIGGLPAAHAQTCGLVETSSFVTPPSGAHTIPSDDGMDFGESIAVSGDRVVIGARETGRNTGGLQYDPGQGFVTAAHDVTFRAAH